MRHRWLRVIVIGAVVGLVAGGVTACGGGTSVGGTAAKEDLLLHGAVLRPANPQPSIILTDTAGAPYNIEARNSHKVTLIYFGYTHCPDVCPTTMADIATALRQSTPAVRRDVTVIFVTVDPHRDSGPVVRRWLNDFSHQFIGLRGSLASVIAAQRAYHLPVSKVSKNGKTVEHSAEVLTFTPDHLMHVFYNESPSTISDLKHDLPILVSDRGFA